MEGFLSNKIFGTLLLKSDEDKVKPVGPAPIIITGIWGTGVAQDWLLCFLLIFPIVVLIIVLSHPMMSYDGDVNHQIILLMFSW